MFRVKFRAQIWKGSTNCQNMSLGKKKKDHHFSSLSRARRTLIQALPCSLNHLDNGIWDENHLPNFGVIRLGYSGNNRYIGCPRMISHVKVYFFFCMISMSILRFFLMPHNNKYTFSYCMNFSFRKSDVPSESYREICKTSLLPHVLFSNITNPCL